MLQMIYRNITTNSTYPTHSNETLKWWNLPEWPGLNLVAMADWWTVNLVQFHRTEKANKFFEGEFRYTHMSWEFYHFRSLFGNGGGGGSVIEARLLIVVSTTGKNAINTIECGMRSAKKTLYRIVSTLFISFFRFCWKHFAPTALPQYHLRQCPL